MKRWVTIIVALILLDIGLFAVFAFNGAENFPEIKKLEKRDKSFSQLSQFFSDLAHEKGAVYAFEVLKRAPMPPNIDLHLLGHTVGDILYDQKGADGMLLCTQDFRNACSHTIVIGTLLEKGPESLSEIAQICQRAPGGKGAYSMCFHGLGHGVLAYNGYVLPAGADMCRTLKKYGGREYVECVGGMIMEMIAGVHDREVWQEQSKVYFKESDPLYPCSADFIDKEAKTMCYTYLTPHLFSAAGADMAMPGPKHFERAFSYCEPLTGESRSACFGGFGKEFTVLAQSRDIRAMETISEDALVKVMKWCDLAKPKDGKVECVTGAVNSLYWGGENGPSGALRFCEVSQTIGLDKSCFGSLFSAISYYVGDEEYRRGICAAVPEEHKKECEDKLRLY